ncbi:amino acid transporter [Cohnella sp. CFH 77786]|uniref:LysE/ArgO family amino acid transporter n=1 Tax=Cohnella sp. CFH 77786 TaxID=2662265 RepID=UPI001C60A4CE|nr:LysE family transporter [Cohnella sp. CFH 77786]MBW5444459.1 amino acid transporter [Cohnella sp. CFH 77786]
MAAAFVHGFILAFGLIIPLGVQNFFVFSQGAVRRFGRAVPIAAAAGLCDMLLITLAVSGVSVVVLNFVWMKTVLVVLGTLFLLYMGYMSWKAKPDTNKSNGHSGASTLRLISYTMMISILNPHAILDTIGVIGTSSIQYSGYEKVAFTGACMAVSWMWFFLLAALGHFVGSKDPTGKLVGALNKVSALVMWAAAVYLVVTL